MERYPFLLRRQFAPLVAQHPGDLRERDFGPLCSELLPALVHEAHVPCEGGLGGIAVPKRFLSLSPFGPASSFSSLLLQNGNERKFRLQEKRITIKEKNKYSFLKHFYQEDIAAIHPCHCHGCSSSLTLEQFWLSSKQSQTRSLTMRSCASLLVQWDNTVITASVFATKLKGAITHETITLWCNCKYFIFIFLFQLTVLSPRLSQSFCLCIMLEESALFDNCKLRSCFAPSWAFAFVHCVPKMWVTEQYVGFVFQPAL